LRFNCDTKKGSPMEIQSAALPCKMRSLSSLDQSCFTINAKRNKSKSANNFLEEPRNISSYITECRKFGKIRNNSGKTSTHRAENIFPKYLLLYVHEIVRKYPREKKRDSSFSNSVQCTGISYLPLV
jgi:hypothetical protein